MSIRIVKREPSLEDKEVILEIDSTQSGQPVENTFSVKGVITDSKGAPVVSVTVRVYDTGLNTNISLGEAVTSATGDYIIYYSNTLLPSGKLRADLLVQVYDTSGQNDVLLGESPVIVSALTSETVDISTAQENYVGPSEYSMVADRLEPYLVGVDIPTMDVEGIAILASKAELQHEIVADYLKAKTLVSDVPVSEEIMYGLMRFDLPYNLADLIKVTDNVITEAIEATTDSNIIDPDLIADIPTIITDFRQGGIDDALVDVNADDGQSDFTKLMNVAGLDSTKQKNFYAYYLDKGDMGPTFWDQVVTDNVLSAQERDDVRLVLQLSVVAQGHTPMVSALKSSPSITSIQDVATLSKTDWLNFINTTGVGVPNIDEVDITEADKQEYADALVLASENVFPTGVLTKSLEGDVDYTGTDILTFVQDNPAYDFKDTSPLRFLLDNPNALDNVSDVDQAKQDIYSTRRLFYLSQGSDKRVDIKALTNSNLTSASRITNVGRRSFVKKYSTTLGGDSVAKKTYTKAVKRYSAALAIQTDYNPSVNNVATRVYGGSPVKESDVAANPELEVFFGSQDYCTCTHCRSSLSPAAYLVDLLAFLKEAENTGGVQTAWEQLQLRRPELQKFELSCTNTNTVLPYIDLVNEVLEFAVSPGTGSDARQTTLDAETLRVEPEYTNTGAYDTLALEVYPWVLPFNLWNQEGVYYLDRLGIKRSDIIRALDGKVGEKDSMSIEEACTYLGISIKMLEVLTNNTSFTAYYDGANTTTLQPVKTLLEKTELEYDELLDLLETTFVNPSDKAIVFTPASSCKIEDATLAFTSAEYINLHRFVRLSHILDWSFSDLDMVITALGVTNITNTLLIQIAGIQKVEKKYKLDPIEIAGWYNTLSDKIYKEEPSQYDSVFLNPVYYSDLNLQAVFRDADTTPVELVTVGGELNAANAAVLLGALQITGEELLFLVNNELPSNTANRSELTHLFRVSSFAKALRIGIKDVVNLKLITGLKPLTEVNPFSAAQPEDSLAFITWLKVINESGFNTDDLNFLLRQVVTPAYPEAELSVISNRIGALRTILQQKLLDKGITIEVGREGLLNIFLLFFDKETATKSIDVVEDLTGAIVGADTFIDSYWVNIVNDVTAVKTNLIGGSALPTLAERYDYMFGALYEALAGELNFDQEVNQYFAESYGSSLDVSAVLLEDQLRNPSNASEPAINLFNSYGFTFSTDDIIVPAYQDHIDTVSLLYKILFVVEKLIIDSTQINFVLSETANTSWYDLKSMPLTFSGGQVSEADFDSFIGLLKAFNLEKKYGTEAFSIISLIKDGVDGVSDTVLFTTLSNGTSWESSDISYLSGIDVFNFGSGDYKNQGWIEKLESVISLSNKLSTSADQINQWRQQDLTAQQAQAIRLSVKSRYKTSEWLKIAADLRDQLRVEQRDALSAYLIANNSSFSTRDDLFSYYLMDTEMSPCMLTSRIKLAVSTVQLWVQRIRMDLETGIGFTEEDLDEWTWRKNYRVWEAARKIFLYPENWIEPELREDKSPFFTELEDELLQDEVNKDTAEKAYLNYLTKLDEVANLEISATYKEEDRNILHVFARTKDSPHIYFYRKLIDEFQWTAWERVDLDIEAEHLIPVIFNRRPMLFWPILNEKPVEVKDDDLTVETSGGSITKDVKNKTPLKKVEIQMAYSEWKNNKWQPKKVSKAYVISSDGVDPSKYFFKIVIDNDGLTIDVFYKLTGYEHQGNFHLNNYSGEFEVSLNKKTSAPNRVSVTESERNYMKIIQNTGGKKFEIAENIKFTKPQLLLVKEQYKADKKEILSVTPSRFKITYPVTGIELLSDRPFFYEDSNRVFFVTASEKTYYKNQIVDLEPEIIKKKVKKPEVTPLPVKKVLPPKKKVIIKALAPVVNTPINTVVKVKKPVAELTREDVVRFQAPEPTKVTTLPLVKTLSTKL